MNVPAFSWHDVSDVSSMVLDFVLRSAVLVLGLRTYGLDVGLAIMVLFISSLPATAGAAGP